MIKTILLKLLIQLPIMFGMARNNVHEELQMSEPLLASSHVTFQAQDNSCEEQQRVPELPQDVIIHHIAKYLPTSGAKDAAQLATPFLLNKDYHQFGKVLYATQMQKHKAFTQAIEKTSLEGFDFEHDGVNATRGKGNLTCNPLDRAILLKDAQAVKILLEHGFDVNKKDGDDLESPLHAICSNGCSTSSTLEIARLLIAYGADLQACNSDGQTALHKAGNNRTANLIQLLLEKGSNINARDQHQRTPLHQAIDNFGNNLRAIELLASDIAINTIDAFGDTPMDLAKRYNRNDIVQLLEKLSAKNHR